MLFISYSRMNSRRIKCVNERRKETMWNLVIEFGFVFEKNKRTNAVSSDDENKLH